MTVILLAENCSEVMFKIAEFRISVHVTMRVFHNKLAIHTQYRQHAVSVRSQAIIIVIASGNKVNNSQLIASMTRMRVDLESSVIDPLTSIHCTVVPFMVGLTGAMDNVETRGDSL